MVLAEYYTDTELNHSAKRVMDCVKMVEQTLLIIARGNQNFPDSESEQVFQQILSNPVGFANSLINRYFKDIDVLKRKAGTFDKSYREISDSFALSIISIVSFPISLIRLHLVAANSPNGSVQGDIQKTRTELSEVALILAQVAQFDISIDTKMIINTLQNEIRNLEKRLDSKTGCFISTLVFGDYNNINVIRLRLYRDNTLYKTRIGRITIKIYYKISPFLIQNTNQKIIRMIFAPIVYALLKTINSHDYDSKR